MEALEDSSRDLEDRSVGKILQIEAHRVKRGNRKQHVKYVNNKSLIYL
jgi:hypothetical protein